MQAGLESLKCLAFAADGLGSEDAFSAAEHRCPGAYCSAKILGFKTLIRETNWHGSVLVYSRMPGVVKVVLSDRVHTQLAVMCCRHLCAWPPGGGASAY